MKREQIYIKDLEANNDAPELSPDLMRLQTSLGLSKRDATTKVDIVKRKGETNDDSSMRTMRL